MPDIVDRETRRRMMSGIRGKDTKPEILVRKGLHARGFRYRLHARDVPGRPDLVLPRYRSVILVHGCFWHGHDCHLFRLPDTRRAFWEAKITRNRERDYQVREELAAAGWRRLVVWECALKGKYRRDPVWVVNRIGEWLTGNDDGLEIGGEVSA